MFCDAGLTQLVDFPTNTLDIFATNQPNLVNKCIPLPGISDHDVVYIESSVYMPPAKRKQLLRSKVNMNDLKDLINNFTRTFLSKYSPGSSIEQMWEEFKAICLECVNLIPSRLITNRYNKPWITANSKQYIRKKKRLYNRARTSGSTEDWNAYRTAKRAAQCEC